MKEGSSREERKNLELREFGSDVWASERCYMGVCRGDSSATIVMIISAPLLSPLPV